MTRKLLIFGAGFSSRAIACQASADFDEIAGTTRSRDNFEAISGYGIKPLLFNGQDADRELITSLREATAILVSIAPAETGDPVLNAIGDELDACPGLKWIGYLSTVGVYGNHDGAWVDENTPCKPVSRRSIQRLAAEKAWRERADRLGLPLSVFRLSGIYGPGRNTFINLEKGRARRLVKPGQVFNRIHRDDIASAVTLAMKKSANAVFNITDDEPAPPQDLVTFAAGLMGIEPPPETDFESADLTVMARSFYGENKRVSNARSKRELGLEYQWPNYRQSLRKLWQEGSWKPVP